MPLLLNEHEVASLLRYEDLVPLMERTLAAFSTGGTVQPVRSIVRIERHGGLLGTMPGYLADDDALGVKLVTLVHANAERGLPTHLATIALLDPMTGVLRALMDGRLITEMRTAAVSAAAARACARRGAGTLALIGAGVQAWSHLRAFAHVFALRDVRVATRTTANADAFARDAAAETGLPVRACPSARDAVAGADLIVTVTASHTPVLESAWIADGAHLSAVGACTAEWRELDGATVGRARTFVDSRAAAAIEAGDLVLAEKEGAIGVGHVAGEIGEVFAGRVRGRERDDQLTLFKSLGLAVEDVATAKLVYDRACTAGVGRMAEV